MTTKQDYLASLQKRADKGTKGTSIKGRKRKRIIAAILAVGSIITICIGAISTKAERQSAYNMFSSGQEQVQFDYLGYEDTFNLWNENQTSADVNSLLSDGKILYRDGVFVFPDMATRGTSAKSGSTCIHITNDPVSYINYYNNILFYRNDRSRDIMMYDIGTRKESTVLSGNVGEILVDNGFIYYIDYASNCHLFRLSMDTGEIGEVLAESISMFSVVGESIVVLLSNNNLYVFNYGKDKELLASSIERFFIDGDIIAESGNTVFRFSTLTKKTTLIYESSTEDFALVGVLENVIYVQEGGKLWHIEAGSEQITIVLDEDYEKYTTLAQLSDGTKYIVVYSDSEKVPVSISMKKLPTVE